MKTQEEIEQLAKKQKDCSKEYCDSIDEQYGYLNGYVEGYTQCQEDMADISKVTRFEVIRVYQKWNCNVELSYQDDDRTLKVFIKPLNKQE